jgi:hypothetical protein
MLRAGQRARRARIAGQGVQSADQKPTHKSPASSRRGFPGPGTRQRDDAAQRLGGAPVRPEPRPGVRVIRAKPQQRCGHRQQAVQVEEAGAACRGALGDQAAAGGGGVAQLAGQDARALEAEAAALRRRRHGEPMKPVLAGGGAIVRPGDHAGAGGRCPEGADLGRRTADA